VPCKGGKAAPRCETFIKHLFDCHLSFKQMYEINLAARMQRGKNIHATIGQRQYC
jgi:hypothetical protein